MLNEDLIEMLITSYGLSYILNYLDLEPTYVLKLLEEQGEIDLNKLEELV